jgi:molecular chaperone GrpE
MTERPKGEGPGDGDVAPDRSAGGREGPRGAERAGNGSPRDDLPEEPATLQHARSIIAELRPEVAALEAKVRDAEDRHLRDRAELENFKRRIQREKSEALRYANEGLLRDLLPALDNLERAVRAADDRRGGDAGAADALITGVEMVQRQLREALERHGVTRIEARGQAFDPALHEAVLRVEADDLPPGSVVDEHAPGYRLHDRLLRAAQVSVAQPPQRREN